MHTSKVNLDRFRGEPCRLYNEKNQLTLILQPVGFLWKLLSSPQFAFCGFYSNLNHELKIFQCVSKCSASVKREPDGHVL